MLRPVASTSGKRQPSKVPTRRKPSRRGNFYGSEASPNLAAVLRSARAHRRFTLREVEERTGIPNGYLSQIEKGRIKKPDPVALWKLSDLYRLDFFQLLNWAGHTKERSDELAISATLLFRLLQEVKPEQQKEALRWLEERAAEARTG